MTICTRDRLSFPGCKGRRVEAELSGGDVVSDGGVLLLRQADRRLGLTAAVAGLMNDFRRRAGSTARAAVRAEGLFRRTSLK